MRISDGSSDVCSSDLATINGGTQLGDLGKWPERQQIVVAPHQSVRDGHDLAEHLARGITDADVVAEALRHLLHAVEPLKDRHRHDALRLLPRGGLKMSSDQEIELLVGPAELNTRPPRSADRRVGKRGVSTCRVWRTP